MEEDARSDRRKVNSPVGDDQRGIRKERRKCPECGSVLHAGVKELDGGTLTTVFCGRCNWKMESKQIDEQKVQELLTWELTIVGNEDRPLLELDPEFLQASTLKIGDHLEIKPVVHPGLRPSLDWLIKKIEE